MEVLDNDGLGGKCLDVVRKRGEWRYGCCRGLIGAIKVHVVDSVVGVASALQDGGRAD